MNQYTDMFDQPLHVGSIVTYTTLRYKSAHQCFAVVEQIVPLIEKPGAWVPTSSNSCIPYIREDQQRNAWPTEFRPLVDAHGRPRLDKLYVAKTRELRHRVKGVFSRTDFRLGSRMAHDLVVLDALGLTIEDES